MSAASLSLSSLRPRVTAGVFGRAFNLLGRADRVCLAALLVLALGIRLALVARAPAFITNDSESYLLPAYDLVEGLGFDPLYKRPPGYPAVVAVALWFFGQQSLTGLLLLQHLLGVLTVAATYALSLLLHGRAAASLAGLLTAVCGPLLVTEHYLMSESLFGLLLVATLLSFVVAAQRRSLGLIALAGLALGLAALTRPVAQLLLPVLALLCLARWAGWRRGLLAAMLLAGCYIATVLPWMARNGAVQGSFTLAGGLGEGLAVRTIRYDQQFDFRAPAGTADRLAVERRIYREEARQESVFQLDERLRSEAGLTPAQADQAMRDVALGAIAQKPGYYLTGSVDMFWQMLVGRPVRLRQDWQPWRGIEWEPRIQHLLPEGAPETDPEFERAQLLFTLYDPARLAIVLIPLLALGIVAGAMRPDRVLMLLPAFAAVSLLLASAFLVGIEWRYRFPLDPLLNATLAGGLVWAAARGRRLLRPERARAGRPSTDAGRPSG
jgi:hypothetical protein